jgi:hypothetical protein
MIIANLFHSASKIALLFALINIFACSSNNNQSEQNSARPTNNQYQQPQYTTVPPTPYAPAPARQDGYYYAPQQQPAYQYQQPASRYYSNPYAMPPQNQYPYYDGDQYYVPPTYYGSPNHDNAFPSASNQKY